VTLLGQGVGPDDPQRFLPTPTTEGYTQLFTAAIEDSILHTTSFFKNLAAQTKTVNGTKPVSRQTLTNQR